jgi:hypothetical protein
MFIWSESSEKLVATDLLDSRPETSHSDSESNWRKSIFLEPVEILTNVPCFCSWDSRERSFLRLNKAVQRNQTLAIPAVPTATRCTYTELTLCVVRAVEQGNSAALYRTRFDSRLVHNTVHRTDCTQGVSVGVQSAITIQIYTKNAGRPVTTVALSSAISALLQLIWDTETLPTYPQRMYLYTLLPFPDERKKHNL